MDPQDPRSPQSYRSVAAAGEDEFIIEKSRFIGYAAPAVSEEDARAFIGTLRKAHPQATHVCSAWIIGAGGLTMHSSDAGEPSGTAGMPMLEVLRAENVTDTVVGAVRYFGGIKLGAGGLTRAYRKTAAIALHAAGIAAYLRHRSLTLTVDYGLSGGVSRRLAETRWLLADTRYDASVHYDLYIPEAECADCEADIQNWCSGRAVCVWGGVSYRPVPAE